MLGVSGQKERAITEGKSEALRQNKSRFLRRLVGREVLVVFRDGKVVQGVLAGSDTYNLFVEGEDGLEVAVFKRAIVLSGERPSPSYAGWAVDPGPY
jgi:hypothetical protein